MSLLLHERAMTDSADVLVRLTSADYAEIPEIRTSATPLIPVRPLVEGEQYRFHFNMTKCIGCRSCEIACNEQNGNPADIRWRRMGEIEGGVYPDAHRHYLSMGCNHCLDPDCLKGCPVNAYTKDPVTGIVLHSADACIGCQYCVWNCPYSVPQFNPERGVVGKCDMCHGRLTDGREPACANACPEGAIEIEIVNTVDWRKNYAAAESPGMPSACHTISTTRITLPAQGAAALERVDLGRIRPEHAHMSLVFMTTLIQMVAGALAATLIWRKASAPVLTLLLFITTVALNISVFHLGRPAYAWRAMKMWRRSWLSREVLLFGLFFGALASTTAAAWFSGHLITLNTRDVSIVGWVAVLFGVAGTIASAFIYLVPARPSWNMAHTPIDFLLSAALIGCTLPPVLEKIAMLLMPEHAFQFADAASSPAWPVLLSAALWLANQAVRLVRLNRSQMFERRASAALLNREKFRTILIVSMTLALVSAVSAIASSYVIAFIASTVAVLLARYLFFVSVVPLNMALTFARASEL
ncbi:hypothetical protein GCM10011507_11040 [Edaphobacter acidisoli]|uniref:4Fe-4S ferredoxin-type domain-containing protein n=1 Tax=Edaphobacter acidisoli TaxID=2040573 RepID=A0A916RL16_9BACT|nr:DmsC/YnfH family molybdoenzyme membrane anchor subunit [Edaphobacter acidisoli]GGA61344.1 hypothetical protein GCM10011507_11040 [Edaphobacter acidisoli]